MGLSLLLGAVRSHSWWRAFELKAKSIEPQSKEYAKVGPKILLARSRYSNHLDSCGQECFALPILGQFQREIALKSGRTIALKTTNSKDEIIMISVCKFARYFYLSTAGVKPSERVMLLPDNGGCRA